MTPAEDNPADDMEPEWGRCRGCGQPFFIVDESGPGLEYCCESCYQLDTEPPRPHGDEYP